ncbi:MAG: GTP 3',8-cyclase MoaA [Verrucomicrobia bacterium]|nr:GTP 3',8-cyclase MoaA [Verrucomicrobiota bacterium]
MLTDGFGRFHDYLRISVTDRCNLRCLYCMPADGLVWKERAEILTFEEIERIAGLLVRQGVRKIRLTGGEPTMRRDLEVLIARLRALPGLQSLVMTTNGLRLADRAARYRAAGLDGLNVSLDTLRPDRFEQMTRRTGLERVRHGLEAALAAGFATVKLNVVVMRGLNDDELPDFARLARTSPLEVRFIEFMPFDRNEWSTDRLVPYAEMRRRVESAVTLQPLAAGPNAVAREFAVAGGAGRIGFVTSMTEDFCAGCNRLRLTADGRLKNCLFSVGEADLRGPLRAGADEAELLAVIRGCVREKWAGHPPPAELAALHNRAMIQIGG